ncbi:MAG: glycosyltransferase [Verrucomicrobiae bacterium]|nr:glycosyltransferase [Verrucomicrobiae bacterium]
MTASYKIPSSISKRIHFRSKPVSARKIMAVIPTFQDWDGLKVTLDSLLNLKTPPLRIAVANDNKEIEIPDWLKNYRVDIINYPGNCGPALARNKGFGFKETYPEEECVKWILSWSNFIENKKFPSYCRSGFCPQLKYPPVEKPTEFFWDSDIDWVYFTDCGCTHSPDIFIEFEKTWKEYGDSCVAISGPVEGLGNGSINEYMTEQGILNAPNESIVQGVYIPQAIITANALVSALPFAFLGGFNPQFDEAAGEDLDLGIRLREFGIIAWSPESKTFHQFKEDDTDFYKRFRRYGRGNRKLELIHRLPCMRAKPFEPDKKGDPEHVRLAKLSVEAMQAGYDEAIDEKERGILKLLSESP